MATLGSTPAAIGQSNTLIWCHFEQTATNRELEEEIRTGGFRSDLYYRLAVVCLRLPPLRQREEDIPLLAQHLLRRAGVVDCGAIEGPNLDRLTGHAWPGNARE